MIKRLQKMRRRVVLLGIVAAAAVGLMWLLPSLADSSDSLSTVAPQQSGRGFMPMANTFGVLGYLDRTTHITAKIASPDGSIIMTTTGTNSI